MQGNDAIHRRCSNQAYLAVNRLPFDSYLVAIDRRQILYFGLYYLALSLPFLCSGLGIAAALAKGGSRSHTVYAANLLGSAGAADGPCLSDGVGIMPGWTEAATQIPRLFALGHNPDPLCRRSPADYFAHSVAQYAVCPRDLNAADPNMHKLLARSFFSESFWRQKNAES